MRVLVVLTSFVLVLLVAGCGQPAAVSVDGAYDVTGVVRASTSSDVTVGLSESVGLEVISNSGGAVLAFSDGEMLTGSVAGRTASFDADRSGASVSYDLTWDAPGSFTGVLQVETSSSGAWQVELIGSRAEATLQPAWWHRSTWLIWRGGW